LYEEDTAAVDVKALKPAVVAISFDQLGVNPHAGTAQLTSFHRALLSQGTTPV
jgi:hypothetical protein